MNLTMYIISYDLKQHGTWKRPVPIVMTARVDLIKRHHDRQRVITVRS